MWFSRSGGVIAVLCLASCASRGAADEVRDRARLFSPAARHQAEDQIRELERLSGKQIVIETSKPGIKEAIAHLFHRPQLKDLAPEAQRRALDEEARLRVQAAGPHTLLVFLYRDPRLSYVQVEVGADPELERVFPASIRAELRERILAQLKANQPDAALAEAVAALGSRLRAGLGQEIAVPHVFHWAPVVWSIVALLGLWLLVELVEVLGGSRPVGGPAGSATLNFAGGTFLAGLFTALANCGSVSAAFRPPCRPHEAPEAEEEPVDLDRHGAETAGHAHDQT